MIPEAGKCRKPETEIIISTSSKACPPGTHKKIQLDPENNEWFEETGQGYRFPDAFYL